jgi:hypothetical protein
MLGGLSPAHASRVISSAKLLRSATSRAMRGDAADIGDEALNVGEAVETTGLNHCPGPASKRLKILREKYQLPHHRLSPWLYPMAQRASATC